jgi:transcriptional regulator with XRE-family HTH domain
MKGFNTILSALRKETGRSQRHVASDLGVSQALLSHYENGAREPKLEFVIKACDYYGVTADYILGRSDKREETASTVLESLGGCVTEFQNLKATGDALIDKLQRITLTN